MRLDVRDQPAVEALARRLADEFGRLDVLVNNTGINRGSATPSEVTAADLREVYETNVIGVIVITVALPSFGAQMRAGVSGLQWVVAGYTLVFAAALLSAGAVGDRYGPKIVFLPGGVKPGEDGHDPREVADIRQGELRRACAHLGVWQLELLGYHDSGMAGRDCQHREDTFCSVPVESAASRIAQLIERYRPQVVVTYDPHSTYQHPDHIHAARIATYAVDTGQIVAKLYYKAHGSSYWRRLNRALADIGIQRPAPSGEILRMLESVEQRITTTVDVSQVIDRKRTALHSHASQIGSSLAGKISAAQFSYVFSPETYIRARDTTGTPIPEDDLFTGFQSAGRHWQCSGGGTGGSRSEPQLER
ncbi:MAG: SDR family NAD(P)-dependent oxidoreductase [Pseudonocardiales bacterium]|nr:SDR family NAD(P)-dependent oxidoreductase [Pseudonocardiales bacterium]